MSNRTLVELNHDFCPGRSTQALAEWGAKMAAYMRAADRTELPYGVTFKHIRHHSDPDPATRLAFADAAEMVLREFVRTNTLAPGGVVTINDEWVEKARALLATLSKGAMTMRRLVIAAALAGSVIMCGVSFGRQDGHGVIRWAGIIGAISLILRFCPLPMVLVLTLAASAGTAWGQTPPKCQFVDGRMTGPQLLCVWPEDVLPPSAPPIAIAPRYTPADLARLRHAEWLLLDTDAMTPWEFKMLIEARVQTDVAAGISPEALEAREKEHR